MTLYKDYVSFNTDLVSKIQNDFPLEFNELLQLPGREWVLVGIFLSYLCGDISKFNDIEIVYFNTKCFSNNYNDKKWRKILRNENCNYFEHRILKMHVIELVNFEDKLSLESFPYKMICFPAMYIDCVLLKKALHIYSNLFVTHKYGKIRFLNEYREKKIRERLLLKSITVEPHSLAFLALGAVALQYRLRFTTFN